MMRYRTASSTGSMAQFAAGSESSLSQMSPHGSDWSCPMTIQPSDGLGSWVRPPMITILVPRFAESALPSAALPSAFPNLHDLPHQFSESILEEEFIGNGHQDAGQSPWDEYPSSHTVADIRGVGGKSNSLQVPSGSRLPEPRKRHGRLSPEPTARPPIMAEPGPSMHCRLCFKSHCEDPTASMCGHVFCNR